MVLDSLVGHRTLVKLRMDSRVDVLDLLGMVVSKEFMNLKEKPRTCVSTSAASLFFCAACMSSARFCSTSCECCSSKLRFRCLVAPRFRSLFSSNRLSSSRALLILRLMSCEGRTIRSARG